MPPKSSLMMDKKKNYTIVFSGLKNGIHHFEYELKPSFFELFETEQEFRNPDIQAVVTLEKKDTMLLFHFNLSGNVEADCDTTGEPFALPVTSDYDLIVKFGEEYQDDGDDIVIIPFSEYEINIAQWLYETVILAIPTKKVHPDVLNGSMQSDILEKLQELQPTEKDEVQDDEPTDPRWDQLKKLLN